MWWTLVFIPFCVPGIWSGFQGVRSGEYRAMWGRTYTGRDAAVVGGVAILIWVGLLIFAFGSFVVGG